MDMNRCNLLVSVKLFNSMLNTNSDTLRRVVQADLNLLFFFWWGLLHGPQQGPDNTASFKCLLDDSSIAERFSGTAWE